MNYFNTMKFIIFLMIVSKIHCFVRLNIFESLILNVVSCKNVKFLTLLTCFTRQDSLKLHKNLNKVLYTSWNFYSEQDIYYNFHSRMHFGYLLDISCENYKKYLHQIEKLNLFQSPYKWFVIDSTNSLLANRSSVVDLFREFPLRIDSDITVLVDFSKSNIAFYDVYKPGINKNEEVKVTQLGFWTAEDGITFSYSSTRYEQRKDLTGTVVPSGIVKTRTDDSQSIDSYYKRTTNNFDIINKLSYSLYIHLQEIHNFSSNITTESKWFGAAVGGVDEGLGKLLHDKRAELGISAGLLKPDRTPLIDFVAPAYPFRTCFVFRNPGISTKVQNEFLQPFEASLWYTTIGFILLFCFILKSFCKLSRDYEEKSWTAAYLLTWAVICQQGATFIPKPTSGRLTLLSLLVMSLLLYNYYTSSIVSSLLSSLPPPFKTIAELTESDLDVGVEDTVYIRTLFEVTKEQDIKYLYKHKVLGRNNQPSYMSVPEGVAKVKDGSFAYHSEPNSIYPIIERAFEPYQICELAEINVFVPTVLWVMMQKRGQYLKLFRIGYLKMLEFGIVNRQRSVWLARKPTCLANTHLVAVGIQPLLPAFLVLLFGIFVSLLLLSLEMLFSKYKPYLLRNYTNRRRRIRK